MSAEMAFTFSPQVAHAYLEQFTGVADANYGHPDTDHSRNAGIIMAHFIKSGETVQFQGLVNDLAPNRAYQTGALVEALEY